MNIVVLLILFIIIIICIILICKRDYFINSNKTIPKIIYLTHKKTVPNYVLKNWKRLNPEYEIKYYNDADIRNFLKKYYPKSYLDYFNMLDSNKGAGPIKADFWRVCILYKFGGIYVDADIEPIESIKTFLEKDTDFLTCVSDKFYDPNPHIIACKSNDILLKECLNIYETKFNTTYDYWKHSITKIMTQVLSKYINKYEYDRHNEKNYYIGNYKVQMLLEKAHNKMHEMYCVYKNKKVLNNRYKEYNISTHNF